MKPYYLRKRNQSLQWIWACLATGELLAWIASGIRTSEGFGLVWMILLIMGTPLLAIAASIHYFFACAYYVSAKGRSNAYPYAACALLVSLPTAAFFFTFAAICKCIWIAYFAIPAVFALAALPFKLMQDRSPMNDLEFLP